MYLIFDTETTGLPQNWKLDYTHSENWPRVVQIAWQLHDDMGNCVEHQDFLIQPDSFNIPFDAEKVHGISTELATEKGQSLDFVLETFKKACDRADFIIGHNIGFDISVMSAEYYRQKPEKPFLQERNVLDTCSNATAELCKLPGGRGGGFKWPKLTELHIHLFGKAFDEAHNATADVEATARVFLELVRLNVFTAEQLHRDAAYRLEFNQRNTRPFEPIGLRHVNLKEASDQLKEENQKKVAKANKKVDLSVLQQIPFAHLHNHTQFTMLQSTMTYKDLIAITAKNNLPAVALTDNGNMMGAFHFERDITAYNKKIEKEKAEAEEKGEPFDKQPILPIIGCEFNVCKNHKNKDYQDNGYQIVMLAKNENGYRNLIKLASIAYTEGSYYVPRIDKQLIEQYHGDVIVLSGNLFGEIPNLILNVGEKQAEEALIWWKNLFGDDFYLEIMRHGQEDENHVNEVLMQFSEKHAVKLVATNNTFYPEKKDSESHDLLLCLKGNEIKTDPVSSRSLRNSFPNDNYYYRTADEMRILFSDVPEALESIAEIISKIEPYHLEHDILLPAFEIPEEFRNPQDLVDHGKRGENNYLRHLTMEGAKKRYGELTDEIKTRIDFELQTIEKTGYPGYFLIVQDFCQAARDMDVSVGPGRGSAAGSAVAYCIGITNVDPIKYDLLFERFLNPERVSMPDIDIDFEDNGRGRVIDWVINKYGANQVSQIITWGTMAAKSSIRDVSRVMNLPLYEADKIAKLIPFGWTLHDIFTLEEDIIRQKLDNKEEEIQKVLELRKIRREKGLAGTVIEEAIKLEGTMRNTGIHACGVIIAPEDLTNYVPVALSKDSTMYCTQFENSVVESAGLLKMDFLGLKTLTLIKDAVRNIAKSHDGLQLDPDAFPIDDTKTYELFQRGETAGIFQYESPGMQKYMRELKPTVFADLIAMNALYRPGPIQYIPTFIRRKNGEEEIQYDLDAMEEYLKETYGVTVYQEQVMLLSQKLANFTKGEADVLRKAMGKKKKDVLAKMKPKFIEQAHNINGHDVKKLEKIWEDWEHFASYAFNKSHSTCYAWIAYQTAYLKANYPAEFMSAVLSNNMNDIKQVSFYMEECLRIGIKVLSPDVNESAYDFTVNRNGEIRFGMGAIKGLGSGPVNAIIEQREADGNYLSIFDFVRRVSLRSCNKKALESIALAGGFDSFENCSRAQLFYEENGRNFIESLIKYGNSYQEGQNSSQFSLFGEGSDVEMPEPLLPSTPDWPTLFKLNKEKEVIGLFISGHPLDDFKLEIDSFCTGNVGMLSTPEEHMNKEILFAGIVTDAGERLDKNSSPYGFMTIEDYDFSHKLFLFRDTYLRFKHFFQVNTFLAIRGKFTLGRFGNKPGFEVLHMERLQDLRENMAHDLQVSVSTNEIDQLLIGELNSIFTEHPGKCGLVFDVYDATNENMRVSMNSRNIRIDPSKEVAKELKQLGIQFKLLSKKK